MARWRINIQWLGYHLIQAAQTPNFTHMAEELSYHLAYVVSQCQARGIRTIEPSEKAESDWVDEVVEKGKMRPEFLAECTPSYLNDEGNIPSKSARNAAYGGGALAYWAITKKWREENELKGMEVTYAVPTAA